MDPSGTPIGELWLFSVDSPDSDGVYLVRGMEKGPTTWQAMERGSSGQWELRCYLEPGQYRFRYYSETGTTFINCGTEHLRTRRLDGHDPQVNVSPSPQAASRRFQTMAS